MSQGSRTDPFVSVIIPVYNDADRLRLCLQALELQSYPAERFDVLVVDNASTEDLSEAMPRDGRFTLLHESTPGSYAARNRGLAVATGEVLAFTDADCIPDKNWLQEAVAALDEDPRADLVRGAVELFFQDGEPKSAAELYESRHGFPQGPRSKQLYAITANLVTRRSVVDRVGTFDARLKSGGDTEFGRRVAQSGGLLRYAPDAVVRHPARSTSDELVARVRRITAGTIDVNYNTDAGRRRLLYLAAREGYLLTRSLAAVTVLGKPPRGAAAKARYLGLYFRLRGIQAWAYTNAALGRRTESPR